MVTSNVDPIYDTITVENFLGDTVVDVKPYVPVNWHPDYRYARFELGEEVNGFTLDTLTTDTNVLVYRHKPGVEYPVTCRLAPETNLQWRNYQFSATIVKPDEVQYDSVTFAVLLHYRSEDSCYKVLFDRDGVHLRGGRWTSDTTLSSSIVFGRGDSLRYKITARTLDDGGTEDAKVSITVEACIGLESSFQTLLLDGEDDNSKRIVDGYPGVLLDPDSGAATLQGTSQPIRIRDSKLAKVE
jgi:hypothetical protein